MKKSFCFFMFISVLAAACSTMRQPPRQTHPAAAKKITGNSGQNKRTNKKAELPTEALVIGRIKAVTRNPITRHSLYFMFIKPDGRKRDLIPDDSGYFVATLPLGRSALYDIGFAQESQHKAEIEDNYVVIDIPSLDSIYYVGDIIVDLTKTKYTLGTSRNMERPPVKLEATMQQLDYYRSVYPDLAAKITTRLMIVNR
jgi:hypothetical protein